MGRSGPYIHLPAAFCERECSCPTWGLELLHNALLIFKACVRPFGREALPINAANNDFISWINISATKTNTKGLYEKILKRTYASCNLTAIKKLSKTPYIGTLNENRICGAM